LTPEPLRPVEIPADLFPKLRTYGRLDLGERKAREMAKYRTMTVDGGYGSTVEADSWEEAEKIAEGPGWGYTVLDWTEHEGENVLVIADE